MSEKKNIDRLFQEKFRDFEAAPPEMAWSNIEAELLKKKKKRRVVPLWYRMAGVAAILVVGLLVSMPFFIGNSDKDGDNNRVVIEHNNGTKDGSGKIFPTDDPIQPNETVTDSSGLSVTDPATAVASEKADSGNGSANPSIKPGKTPGNKKRTGNEKTASPENAVASGSANKNNSTQLKVKRSSRHGRTFNTTPTEEGIAHKGSKRRNQDSSGNNKRGKQSQHNNTAVAQREAGNGSSVKNRDARQFEDVRSNGSISSPESQNHGVAVTPDNGSNSAVKNNIVIDKDKSVIDAGKANEAVAAVTVTNDSVATPPENELEKLLKEKQLDKEKEEQKALADNATKWNIKPQMAPVFYNSIGDGSPIDPQLAGNSKSYDNDLSYGLGINYALSDRISIRSGINTVNLSYSTNNIQFYAALNDQTPNITGRGTKANIVVENQGTATDNSGGNGFAAEGVASQKFNGAMVQKMGYIEVPLEMSYKLLNKRFGIDVIGGVSTLFLNDNNVSVVSNQGLSSDMGEAQNLNDIHFSTNIGVGFRYRFWKAFEANFEPMFKYQLNTFSSDSGNFKPYFIGLYSGISFSF